MKCPECKMLYSKDSQTDRREHSRYHDSIVNGHRSKIYKKEKVIFQASDYRITVVDKRSTRYETERALAVGVMGYTESGYDSRPFDKSELFDSRTQVTVFLVHCHDRTIGVLVAERATIKWKMTWDEYSNRDVPPEVDSGENLWSGRFIWVHIKHRRKGLAKQLVSSALDFLGIGIEEFAYSSQLSKDGEMLARSLSSRFLGIEFHFSPVGSSLGPQPRQ